MILLVKGRPLGSEGVNNVHRSCHSHEPTALPGEVSQKEPGLSLSTGWRQNSLAEKDIFASWILTSNHSVSDNNSV